jgi:hypothetical protein
VAEHETAVDGSGQRGGVAEEVIAAALEGHLFAADLFSGDGDQIALVEAPFAFEPALAAVLLDVGGAVREGEGAGEAGLAGGFGAEQCDALDERGVDVRA